MTTGRQWRPLPCRCQYDNWEAMETIAECVCCQEQGNVCRKIEEHGDIMCITNQTNVDSVFTRIPFIGRSVVYI